MIDALRRRMVKTLRQTRRRADRARHVWGRMERLEARTVLSASLGALPPWPDGTVLAGQDVHPEPAEYLSASWSSAMPTDSATASQAGTRWDEIPPGAEPLLVWNLAVPSNARPRMEQTHHVILVVVEEPSWDMSGSVTLVFPAASSPTSPSAGAPTGVETTGPATSLPPGALGITSTAAPTDADEPAAPRSDADSGRSPAEPAHLAYVRPPAPLWADPAMLLADAAWYSLLSTSPTADSLGSSSSPMSEANRVSAASLSAYDAAFEAYLMQPLTLVRSAASADQPVPHAALDAPADADGQSQGGFVDLDSSELGDELTPPDVAGSQSDAIDAVLADLADVPDRADQHAAEAAPAGKYEDTQTPAAPDAAPVPLADVAAGPADYGTTEGGMILLQPATSGGEEAGDLAAVYLVSPDKLLEANVEMDASIGIYQALDVAAENLRQADREPVPAAEPLGTRSGHAAEKVSTGDSQPAAAGRAAAWVGTLLVAGSSLAAARPEAERRDQRRSPR